MSEKNDIAKAKLEYIEARKRMKDAKKALNEAGSHARSVGGGELRNVTIKVPRAHFLTLEATGKNHPAEFALAAFHEKFDRDVDVGEAE